MCADVRALDIDALYREHAPFIGRVIQRLAGDGPHVDDLLQETFIVAFGKRARFDGAEDGIRPWLYAIAANLCKRHFRGSGRFGRLRARLVEEPKLAPERPDEQIEREQRVAIVHHALQDLPFKQREVLVLYELEGLPGEEIAQLIGVPLGTVWTRLHHARRKFYALVRRRMTQEAAK